MVVFVQILRQKIKNSNFLKNILLKYLFNISIYYIGCLLNNVENSRREWFDGFQIDYLNKNYNKL